MVREPGYRKKINQKQLELLHVLYRFRFATTDQMAAYLGKPTGTRIYRRIMTLVEQEYVGRNFEPAFRKRDMHATYYLRAKGIAALKDRQDKTYDPKVLHNIYGDAGASEQFIADSITIFDTYTQLKAYYGDKLHFFTKSDLAGFEHGHFPKPLPDAYIRLNTGREGKQFFFDVHTVEQPFFKLPKRIKEYVAHADSRIWQETGEELPKILAICDKASTQKRLQKNITKQKHTDLRFFSAIKGALNDLSSDTNVWHPAAKLSDITSLEAA